MNPNQTRTEKNPTDLILENLLDAVLIVDDMGIILYANKAAEWMFSKKASQLLMQNFGFPVIPFEVQEIQVMKQDRILVVQMLASHIEWLGKKAFLLSLRDITEQKRVEAELFEERKKLELTSLENAQYASLASHDLKEPVRKIQIFCDRLLHVSGKDLDSKVLDQLHKIYASANRMQLLINGIAEYSQISKISEAYIPTDLNAVIDDVKTDLELLIVEKEVEMWVDELGEVEAVPVQMHQLFLNLISNSIKYSKEGIAPLIRIRNISDTDTELKFVISDNGIGFENQFAERVFQPFARLHSSHSDGSGIGLAICRKIVEAHNGTISVSSQTAIGTEFFITIPRKQETD